MAICVCSSKCQFLGSGDISKYAHCRGNPGLLGLPLEVSCVKKADDRDIEHLTPNNWIPKTITRLAYFPPYMSTNHQALQVNAIAPPYRIALLGTTHLALPISMHCGSTSGDPRHCMRRVRSFEQIYCPSIHRLVIILLNIARRAYVGSFPLSRRHRCRAF